MKASPPLSAAERLVVLDRLATGRPGPGEVAGLLAGDPAGVYAALGYVARRLDEGGDDEAGAWAGLIPRSVEGVAPEVAVAIADLHARGLPGTPRLVGGAPARSAVVAWARAWLVEAPAAAVAEVEAAAVYAALDSMDWDGVADPLAVLDAARGGWARPVARALAAMGAGGRLPAGAVVPRLVDLLATAAADVAVEALAAPWAVGEAVPGPALVAQLDAPHGEAAARALAARGHGLRDLLGDDGRAPGAYAAVMGALAPNAEAIDRVLNRALADPLALARPAWGALARLRAGGVRLPVDRVGAAFALYVQGPPVDAAQVAHTLGHPEAVLDAIDARLDEDPLRVRSVALLGALASDRSTARLIELLDAPRHRHLATAVIEALATRVDDPTVVTALTQHLDRRPVEGARALAAVVGAATIEAAATLDARTAAALRLRHAPEGSAWAGWVARGAVDAGVIAALSAATFEVARGDLEAWAAHDGHPLRRAAIGALGRLGDLRSLSALAGGLLVEDRRDEVAVGTRAALVSIGERAGAQGGGPRCVARALARLLPLGDAPTVRRLLEAIAGGGPHDMGRAVRPALRHRDPELRGWAVRALAGADDPAATAWIASLGDDPDHRVLRAVYEALGTRGDRSASALLCRGLDHPLMNLKKSSARALATAGDVDALPAVLRWLGRHDNPGFRALLGAAVHAIAGEGALGVLRGALDAAGDDAERVRRLLPALDGRVGAARLQRWRDEARWGALLGAALDEGRVTPRTGAVEADPPDPGDVAARAARAALLGWVVGEAPGAALAALPSLALDGPVDPAVFDRLVALYDAPDAPRGLLARHLARPTTVDAARRFAAICALRRHAASAEADDALVALGALPDDAERLRWADDRDRARAVAAERGSPFEERAGGDAARRARIEALVDAADPAEALAAELDALALERSAVREPACAVLLVDYAWCVGDRVEALARVLTPPRWGDLLCSLRTWRRVDPRADHTIDALARRGPVPVHDEDMIRVWRDRPSEAGAARLRAAVEGPEPRLAQAAEAALAALGRLSIEAHVEALRAGRPSPGGELGGVALRVALEGLALDRPYGGALDSPAAVEWWLRAPPTRRAFDADGLWPHLIREMKAGRFEALGRVSASSPTARRLPPPAVVELYGSLDPTSDGAARLRRFWATEARLGPVHAPGLLDALLAAPEALDAAGWATLVALTDTRRAEARDRVVAALMAALDPSEAGARLVEALAEHPATAAIPLLRPWRAVDVVADRLGALLVGRDPAGRVLIPAALHPALLDRRIAALGERRAEGPKATLSTLVALDAPGTTARLVEALDHRSPAVRAHAHRLLRRHAPRRVYLEATHRHLLSGRHPQVMRRAVRVLCYAGHVEAVGDVVEHLYSDDQALRSAAHDGLVYLGDAARGALSKARGRARPDRRAAIDAVLADIEAGRDVDDEPADG